MGSVAFSINPRKFWRLVCTRTAVPTKAKHKAFVTMKNETIVPLAGKETIVPLAGKEVNRASRRRGAKKGICKSLLTKERQQARTKRKKSRKRRRPLPPVEYEAISENPRVLKLRNGVELRQAISGVGLYLSQSGRVYSLTAFGLRPRRTRFLKKNNYGKKTSGGTAQGQRYPYIMFQGRKYEVHILVTLAWLRPRREGEEIDHINGNIDDCRLINLRIVTREENRRCAQILCRLRKAAKQLNDPSLDPLNIPQSRLLKIFATLTVGDPAKIMEDDFKHHREF